VLLRKEQHLLLWLTCQFFQWLFLLYIREYIVSMRPEKDTKSGYLRKGTE